MLKQPNIYPVLNCYQRLKKFNKNYVCKISKPYVTYLIYTSQHSWMQISTDFNCNKAVVPQPWSFSRMALAHIMAHTSKATIA